MCSDLQGITILLQVNAMCKELAEYSKKSTQLEKVESTAQQNCTLQVQDALDKMKSNLVKTVKNNTAQDAKKKRMKMFNMMMEQMNF